MNALYSSSKEDLSDSSSPESQTHQLYQDSPSNITTPGRERNSSLTVNEWKKNSQLSPIFPSPFHFSPSSPQDQYSIYSTLDSTKTGVQHIPNRSRQSRSPKSSFGTANRKKGTGAWSEEEDVRLRDLVLEFGTKNWVVVEQGMEGRDKKQCRERWCNHVNPYINDAPFSDEESKFIIDFYIRFGRQLARMSRCAELKNRPDNAIKNHFNTNLRDHYSELCRVHGIPRRLQNDVNPISQSMYEQIKGKITAPQHPNVRSSKASRFILTADDQIGGTQEKQRPSSAGNGQVVSHSNNPWHGTNGEPSRPKTQDGSPASWQQHSSFGHSRSMGQGKHWVSRPHTSQTTFQSRPFFKQWDKRISLASSSRPETETTMDLFKDGKGGFRLPLPRTPVSPLFEGSSLAPSTPISSIQPSEIDDEHKNKLWQSMHLANKPNRHNSISSVPNPRVEPYPSVLTRTMAHRRNSAPVWTPALQNAHEMRSRRLSVYKPPQPVLKLTEANLSIFTQANRLRRSFDQGQQQQPSGLVSQGNNKS